MANERSAKFIPYFALACMAVFLSMIISLAIHTIRTGETSMNSRNPYAWGGAAVLFTGFVLLYKLVPGRLKCTLCGETGRDYLSSKGRKYRRLCRAHLIDEFKKEFVSCSEKMVVLYPGLETKTGSSYIYWYMPMSHTSKGGREDDSVKLMKRALGMISGSCERCGRAATVAYYGPGSFQWEEDRKGTPTEWDFPVYEDVTATPRIVCTQCIVDEIAYSLRSYQGHFANGVILPFDGPGMLHPGVF